MSRHSLNDAEQGFLSALLDEAAVKVAVELEPGTAEVLGTQTVSPSVLKDLERSAASGPPAEQPEQAAPAAQAPREPPAEEDAPRKEQQLVEFKDELPSPVQLDVPELAEAEDAQPEVDEELEAEADEAGEAEQLEEPELPLRSVAGGAFSDKKAHPLALFDLLNLAFGEEWTDWESDTLYWGIRRSYGPIGELNRNKVMALRLAASTDVPWLDWDVFEDCGLAWNNIIPLMGVFQPMTPMQAAFAVSCLREIRDEEELGHEVLAYMAAILDEHGWVYAPEEFFGDVGSVLQKNQQQVSFRSDVKAAWRRVRQMDPQSITFDEENALDVHIVKLFVVQSYLQEMQERRNASVRPAATGTGAPPIPTAS